MCQESKGTEGTTDRRVKGNDDLPDSALIVMGNITGSPAMLEVAKVRARGPIEAASGREEKGSGGKDFHGREPVAPLKRVSRPRAGIEADY